MHTLADFIELRLTWAKVDLQALGVLSSAVRKINKYNVKSGSVQKSQFFKFLNSSQVMI